MPFMLPGRSSLLAQAGYQNPKSGALLEGKVSESRSKWVSLDRGTISAALNRVKGTVLTAKRGEDYSRKPAGT